MLPPVSGPSLQTLEQLRGMMREDFHLSKLKLS